MKIAVLSGKGGTGKTFVSVNLAASLPNSTYIDCDVEEPNGRIFMKPQNVVTKTVTTKTPVFDEKLCNGCRACVDFCHFNALVFIKDKPMIFTDICHSCGGCSMVCKQGAIKEEDRPVGSLEIGDSDNTHIITGILNLGEASAVPVIKSALSEIPDNTDTVIIDCPPGSSCSVMESISNADFCIIVAEGTSFGLQNFCLVHELTEILKKPCGVIINKFENEYPPLNKYCEEKGIPILLKIPYKKSASKSISDGNLVSRTDPEYAALFKSLIEKLEV